MATYLPSIDVVYNANIIHSLSMDELEVVEDGAIGVDQLGIIVFIAKNSKELALYLDKYKVHSVKVKYLKNKFLIPGFIDTHIHAPQYVFSGVGNGMPLLEWLNKYTFPCESKFDDLELADHVYRKVVRRLLRNGTTTASYFATIHLEATKRLLDICKEYGQRALVGKVCMDTQSPDYYKDSSTESSWQDTLALIEHCHKNPSELVSPVITPRFAIACTSELMFKLGKLASKYNLHIQSHLSENLKEVKLVHELYPGLNYTQVYDKHGLLTSKTNMAHCVHITDEEISLLKERDVGISHCPTSNLCLLSGIFDLGRIRAANIKIGLGTDVSGGYTTSMLGAIRDCLKIASFMHIKDEDTNNIGQYCGCKNNQEKHLLLSSHLPNINELSKDDDHLNHNISTIKPFKFTEAFFLATLGGAQVLDMSDRIGNFQVGKAFDAQVINPNVLGSPFDLFGNETILELFEKFIFLGDDRHVEQVYVQGRPTL